MSCRNYLIYLEGIESGTGLRQSTQDLGVYTKVCFSYIQVGGQLKKPKRKPKRKMKKKLLLLFFINLTCFGQTNVKSDICWDGTINNKIPIFIHYVIDDKVIIGEITYLNTKDKKPIKLIGYFEDKNSFRLFEFDKKGNITGIIIASPTKSELKGTWVSPKTSKEIALKAKINETSKITSNYKVNPNGIFGDYHYSYGNLLWNGSFSIEKDKAKNIFFEIISVGKGEAPSIAQVERDKIKLNGNSFVYKMPYSKNCEFKIKFYKDFVYVEDLGGDCVGQFGMGAYIDGIYLKTE